MQCYEGVLKDKVVVVTGAGRGIGRALAEGFAREGCRVACLARTLSEIETVAAGIRSTGGEAIAVSSDVTDLASVEAAFQSVAQAWGGIDIVLVNAGVNNIRALIGEDDASLWCDTIEVNLFGAYHCIRASIPYLKARGEGRIIAIGSGRGRRGDTSSSSYACSKAALCMLVRVVAEELRPFNITVNELIPGPVDTDMNRKFSKQTIDPIFTTGSEWVKQPEDLIPLALFMASLPTYGPTAQSFSFARREL